MTSLVRRILQTSHAIAVAILLLYDRELSAESVQLNAFGENVAIGQDTAFQMNHFTVETWFKQTTGGFASTVNTVTSVPLISRGDASSFYLGVAGGRLHG